MRSVILIIFTCVLVGCGAPSEAQIQAAIQATQVAAEATAAADACSTAKLTSYADTIEQQMQFFEQQTTVTGTTPRASIGVPLQKLLDLQQETQKMEHPDCVEEYHKQVVSMMGLYRLGYQTFAAQGDEIMVQASLQVGDETLKTLREGLKTLRAGSVPPVPTPQPTPQA